MVIFAYRQGLKDGKAINNNQEIKPVISPKLPFKSKVEKQQEKETERTNTILNNINNYDGTGKNQKAVNK